jgi:hypothetical protein
MNEPEVRPRALAAAAAAAAAAAGGWRWWLALIWLGL